MNEMALAVLRRQIVKHLTKVFPFNGQPVANVYTKAFKAALQRAGIEDVEWHDLRHIFATRHGQPGTPTHKLQRLGGWKTGAMVERYAHVAPEALQGAANRLDTFGGCALATPEGKRASSI
ncbi:MAG: tyrosine-type recombinase/integrase [Caldimonas sp.]